MEYSILFLLLLFVPDADSGFCNQYYTCSKSCYTHVPAYTSCGFLWFGRCVKYTSVQTVCYGTCEMLACCAGYTGSTCETEISTISSTVTSGRITTSESSATYVDERTTGLLVASIIVIIIVVGVGLVVGAVFLIRKCQQPRITPSSKT